MSTDVLVALGGTALSIALVGLSMIFIVTVDDPSTRTWFGGPSDARWRLLVGLTHLSLFAQLHPLVVNLRELVTWI